jgi:hypothetical protein
MCSREQFIGAQVELGPREQPRAAFVASEVRELWGTLPREASLHVKAPEIRGALEGFLGAEAELQPREAPLVASVLVALDEAAQTPR